MRNFHLIYQNVRGIKSKLESVKSMLKENKPTVMIMVETHLSNADRVESMDGYKIIRKERENEEGGGILVLVKNCMETLLVEMEEEKETEMIWIKIKNMRMTYKIGAIYMPQENRKTKIQLQEIYTKIGKEISDAKQKGEKVLLIGDFNCKVGKMIEGNDEKVSKGGKILNSMMNRHKMVMINATEVCKGIWTREENRKKSVLDYCITFEEDEKYVKEMEIDESRMNGVYAVKQTKNPKVMLSDHHRIDIKLDMLEAAIDENRRQISRIMDKKGYQKFQRLCNSSKISQIINNEENIQDQYTKWSKRVKEIKERCEKKVKRKNNDANTKWNRIMRRIERTIRKAMKKRKYNKYSKEEQDIAKARLELIRFHIEEENKRRNKDRIDKTMQEIKEQGGVNGETFWKFKKKFQRRQEEHMSMVYSKNGERIEDREGIKERYREFYKELLKTKESKTEREREIEERVNQDASRIVETGLKMKQRKISIQDLETVKKQLKRKKAKDRDGWKNEMILEGGKEMDLSIVKILNRIQQEKKIVNVLNSTGIIGRIHINRHQGRKGRKRIIGKQVKRC